MHTKNLKECCFVETNLALLNRPMIRGWDSVGGQSEAGATNKGSGTANLFKILELSKKNLVTRNLKCHDRLQHSKTDLWYMVGNWLEGSQKQT